MEQLIEFLREEFPKDALDIQECIDLLNQSIGGSIESVKSAINRAIDQRDYDKLTPLQQMLKKIDEIQNKLEDYSNMLQLDEDIEDSIIDEEVIDTDDKQLPDYESLRVDQNIPYTLHDDYTYKRPAGFEIFGERHDAKDWKDVLVQTSEILAAKDINRFCDFVNDKHMQGRKVPYFCKDPKLIRAPREITGTDIFVMTNMSANRVRNVIEKMIKKYGVEINDYKLYLKADYTARHE